MRFFAGIPLVPFLVAQKEAFENAKFKELLIALGMQEPVKEMVFIFRMKSFLSHNIKMDLKNIFN